MEREGDTESACVGIDQVDACIGAERDVLGEPDIDGDAWFDEPPRGYASVAFVAYLADSGELLASSGPFVGRSNREDYWLLFTGPRPTGNIPTVQRR